MFCPRCGQQGAIDVRFCSRCGLPLNVIADVTANQGMAAPPVVPVKFSERPPRQKGLRIGTMLMLAAVVLTPLFFGLSVAVDGPAPLLVPLTVLLSGLCLVLYSRAFKDDFVAAAKSQPFQMARPPDKAILLPQASSLEGLGKRRVNTAEVAEPPSVTDHTTQIFD